MKQLPTLIIHGWSDQSSSFRPLGKFLASNGHDVRHLYLADYLSMYDEIKLEDLGYAMQRALAASGIPAGPHQFDAVVHSTGGLVVREFLKQVCRDENGTPNPSLTPIRNLLMLAPANFGSPLAKMGKSMLGRLTKGWKQNGLFETGKRILDALELASPITMQLAQADLFDPGFPIFDPKHTRVTVMVGSNAYDDKVRSLIHENGSDGTVRVSTANLNAKWFKMRFRDNELPELTESEPNTGELAFAVLNRNHGSITKDVVLDQAVWRKLVLDSLNVDETTYVQHTRFCQEVTQNTFAEGAQRRLKDQRERFHQYIHAVFRVRDQYGEPIPDYFVEFYQSEGDVRSQVMQKIHGEILEKVSIYAMDRSYRAFLFDLTDLVEEQRKNADLRIHMRIFAADLSTRIRFEAASNLANTPGIPVYSSDLNRFFLPNRTVFVDVELHRLPSNDVFQIHPLGN